MPETISYLSGKAAIPVSTDNPLPVTSGVAAGAATAVNQTTLNTNLGAVADSAYAGSGSSSVIAALKGVYAKLASGISVITTKATLTATSMSGTITTGGTAQPAIAANASRKGWAFGNVSATMYLTDDGSTPSLTNGMAVSPGQMLDDGGNVSGLVIKCFCATTGATFSAVEYS